MVKKNLKRIIIIAVFILLIIQTKSYCVYTIQSTATTSKWVQIPASAAYDVCQGLNNNYSTLGESDVEAHLITNADYYAVSVLTYSSYGSGSNSNTTGNKSGVMNWGTTITFTSSLMENAESGNTTTWASLYANKDTKYVEIVKNSSNRASNARGLGLLEDEVLSSSTVAYSNNTSYAVCTRTGLFGFHLGHSGYGGLGNTGTSGAAANNITFRPAIWNK